MTGIELKDRNDNETTYTGISKLKVPAADGGEDVVFQLPPVMQEKAVTITENGTTSIVPDEGKAGLSKVNVTVDVAGGGTVKLQEKTETYYPDSTGVDTLYIIEPDAGYDGLAKVEVTVGGYTIPTIQANRAFGTITENGEYSVGPDEAGAEAVGMVNFTVNVPQSSGDGNRVVTPLSETETVTTGTRLGLLLALNDRDTVYEYSSRSSEYIIIRATATAGSASFDIPIFFYGDYDTSLFLQFSGVTGKISFISMAGSVQADYSSDGIVLTPELLDDIKSKTTAYIRTALSLENLEISYSNPMYVSLLVSGSQV
nr:MAG TPA: hypothetical protein [Caudoviricetes sp.]